MAGAFYFLYIIFLDFILKVLYTVNALNNYEGEIMNKKEIKSRFKSEKKQLREDYSKNKDSLKSEIKKNKNELK